MDHTLLAALVSIPFLIAVIKRQLSYRHLDLPTPGYAGHLSSYLSSVRFLREADSVLQAGYKQFKNKVFKVSEMDHWLAIATGYELTENLRTAPEHILSMEAAMSDILQSDYTLGRQIKHDTYHISVIRFALNKNLNAILPDFLDEMVSAFEDGVDSQIRQNDWTAISAVETMTRIFCRSSNRIFVGLPICRDLDYCNINTQFAFSVVIGGAIINLFPDFLKPLVGAIHSRVSGHQRRMAVILEPTIKERKSHILKHGTDYPDKPNDLLSWLMDAASPGLEQTVDSLALRVLNVNFVALHSSSMSFTHALYHLASKTNYIPILRAETERELGNDRGNWTKEALEACWKLDSFLKESQRLNGLGSLSMPRKALVPFTFSDGTTIPTGTMVAAAATATHRDPDIYDNPDNFDPFRFSTPRERAKENKGESGEEDARLRLTGTGPGYLAFGGGRHACPGRFFVSLSMKSMMAYILLHYDIKMEKEGVRPEDEWFGAACVPNRKAKVLFRKRTLAV